MIRRGRLCQWAVIALTVMAFVGCASSSKKAPPPPLSEESPVASATADSVSFAGEALKETVSDSLALRSSWTYYQYGLQAIDNQEWLLAKHYLDLSLKQLISEKYDTLYRNVSPKEDSLYRARMPQRIVRALDEVYPNLANLASNAEDYVQNEVSIEGVDGLEETSADSAALQVIENFLDTLDVSQFSLPVEFNDRVMQEIFYMTGSARKFMQGSLNRKTAYDSLITAKLDSAQVPRDLIYLALVESGFKWKAYSRAKAAGMWQFIPETGKRYGLDVDFWIDMRRDPAKATDAAIKYLSRLHDEFGDWLLAMAAYNCGEGRIRRVLREMSADSTRDTTKAITYWDMELPKETMRYVPRILAAMVIGHFPEEYEMIIEETKVDEYDTVTVFDSFQLEDVAKLLKVPEEKLRDLNMELVKWCTPPNKDSYVLRLPVGRRGDFIDGYDRLPRNDFSGWHHHRVRSGENLGSISRQYGLSVSEIQKANDMKNTRLRAGQSLLIPIKVTPKKVSGQKPTKIRTYVATLGDNLASIARKYGVSQESLRLWNNMDGTSVVKAGDTVIVSKPELRPSEPTVLVLKKGEKYVVRSGDSYNSISKAYGVPVLMLLEANHGFTKRLSVGDSLVIPQFVQPKRVKNQPAPKATEKAKGNDKSKASDKSSEKSKASDKKNDKKAEKKPEPTKTYTVQSGDNLSYIAKKFNTTVENIQELNKMGKSTSIYAGQKLKVQGTPDKSSAKAPSKPAPGEIIHTVGKGESLWDIARQYKVTIEDIVRWNDLKDTKIRDGAKLKIKK